MISLKINLISPFFQLLSFAAHRKGVLAASILLAVIGTFLGFIPYVVVYLITVALLNPPLDTSYIWFLATVVFITMIGRTVLMYFSTVLSHLAAFDTVVWVKRALVKKIGKLSLGFFNTRTSGGIRKIITEDTDRIELFIAHHLPDTISSVLLPIFAIAYMFLIDWRIALAALVPLPLAILAMIISFHESENRSLTLFYNALERMNGIIVEYVRGMPVIKIFNQTTTSFGRLSESVQEYSNYIVNWMKEVAPFYAAFTVCINLPILFILPPCIWYIMTGTLTISEMVLFLILGTAYTSTMKKMGMFSGMCRQITEGIKRIDAILNEPDLPVTKAGKIPNEYSISLQHVTFGYTDHSVIEDISLTAPSGKITALVGPSGSGKSTIAQLIPRFWEVNKGSISIGGIDVREIDPEHLMDMIAVVFQDVFLFHETIEENIRMGQNNKPFNEVIIAAQAAQAHKFIMELPKGYQTIIGSEGTHLSGGEQQRIVLARAIFKNPPIVILDEATAFADPENEYHIQQAINSLLKDRTVIMIAHRLSTIIRADQIIVLDEGRISEKGKHKDLIDQKNQYFRMWQAHMTSKSWQLNTRGIV